MKVVYIISLLFLLISCQNSVESIVYFENGNIKSKGYLKNGKQEGFLYTYNINGKLESKTEWHDGLQNGISEFYFPDGKIKEKTAWKNGKAEGLAIQFYSNGRIKKKAFYKNDKIYGEIINFNSEGKPIEKRIHNETGDVIYFNTYDSTGNANPPIVVPFFHDTKDTFNLNEPFRTEVNFGFKLSGSLKMIIGRLNDANEVVDTTAVLEQDKNGMFIYSSAINKPGRNEFYIKFVHSPRKDDTLSVDGLSTKHVYYVKK